MNKIYILLLFFTVSLFCKAQQGTFKDYRDGTTYKWVKIGNQTWMAENLNYDAGSGTWTNTFVKLAYDFTDYGYFYSWETARTVCPDGWHLPSLHEWKKLINYVGGEPIAGKKLKSKNKWEDNGNGTDNYDFSALPGGTKGSVNWVYDKGFWWTSTEESSGDTWMVNMSSRDDGAWLRHGSTFKSHNGENYYYNVRCIKE